MGFRKIRSVNLSYAKQGQIYFTLCNYKSVAEPTRARIDALIREAAQGDAAYEKALRAWLLRGERWDAIIQRYRVNEKTLLKRRKWFYENW